ncbi:MAG: PQQ-binding-like beta-propeller repeat protein [Acidobacteriota bacterium]|nr:PQQ-binding-like beta-propeller repeat protein [Acidobacteriota bacterium]
MSRSRCFVLALLFAGTLSAVILSAAPLAASADWPHLRGPLQDGRAEAEIFEGEGLGLELAWRVPLGSGYSGITAAGDRAVTAYSRDGVDWVAAFDLASGEELWRVAQDATFPGRNGAHDGPLSTPVLGDGRVYVLAPRGILRALALADGKILWEVRLDQAHGGQQPDFGFVTTPVLAGETLLVQGGGNEGRSMLAFDTADGSLRWSHGDGKVTHQSPVAMSLAGRLQIVTATQSEISGLAAETGEELWTLPLEEGQASGDTVPSTMGEDRFLVPGGGGFIAYRVAANEEGGEHPFRVEELYRTTALGRSYPPPVYHQGYLYGYRGQILTCVDAASGERVWRSRPPGGSGLILVQDHLVIYGSHGHVVVAEATPEGYREKARVQALSGSALTWPSFAGGRILVRNLEELAAVSVTRSAGSAAAEVAGTAEAGEGSEEGQLATWLSRAEAAEDPQKVVDELWEKHSTLPIVESSSDGSERVHFLYRGDAQEVALSGSMLDAQARRPLERLAGTDLFYTTLELEPGLRWEYRFQVDFEDWQADPKNPRQLPPVGGRGTVSELVSDKYPGGALPEPPAEPRGRMETFLLPSTHLEGDKEIQVWLPPAHGEGDDRYPLLVVHDGRAWLERGEMVQTLDEVVGAEVQPMVVAFVPAGNAWWLEAGGTRTAEYARMVAEELLPELERRYRILPGPSHRAQLGLRYFGLSSAYVALRYPELFGHAVMQSPSLSLGAREELERMIRQGEPAAVRFYLDWNRHDVRMVDRGMDVGEESRELERLLRGEGYAVSGGEMLDSYGWGAWRRRLGRVLAELFPLAPASG